MESTELPHPCPGNPGSQRSFQSLPVLPFPECHRVEISHFVALSDWLLSLGHMHFLFLHSLSQLDSSLLFSAE